MAEHPMEHPVTSIERAVKRFEESSSRVSSGSESVPAQEQATQGTETEDATPTVSLDFEGLYRQGLLTPKDANDPVSEEFRLIKRPLLTNAFQPSADSDSNELSNLIMTTSALDGEGKTFTSFNLALSIALEWDYTVLLVDADVGRCALTRLVGLEDSPGLIDVLLDPQLDLARVIATTDMTTMRILPVGCNHPRSTELLASRHMWRVATELAHRYPDRIVLFDSPPLLLASQATVLASLVGQVVLVVEAEKTPQHLVKEALGLLDSSKGVGVVLNKSRQSSKGGYYSGYYGRYA